ncbi:MAG: hypothetical protein QW416_07635 [Candidatus Nitrosocaldaceae archaeon]
MILDGKIYTVRIVTTSSFDGTSDNDFIVGTNSDDEIYGKEGDDFIVGLDGNDTLYGDGIFGTLSDNTLEGGNDILCGNDDDTLYGDGIYGDFGDDTLTGGNDTLEGGDDNDTLYGDNIDGGAGNDTAYRGNDIINAVDTKNNDNIDGDYVIAGTLTLGNQDICASDTGDTEINCEYDNISSLTTLSTSAGSSSIPIGSSVNITFTSSVDNIVKITDFTVTTPLNNTCTYNTLPVTVPPSPFTATYPTNFTGTGCDTSNPGTYQVKIITEVGDPITTTFNASFNVVS